MLQKAQSSTSFPRTVHTQISGRGEQDRPRRERSKETPSEEEIELSLEEEGGLSLKEKTGENTTGGLSVGGRNNGGHGKSLLDFTKDETFDDVKQTSFKNSTFWEKGDKGLVTHILEKDRMVKGSLDGCEVSVDDFLIF
jgi:hypothetical protein